MNESNLRVELEEVWVPKDVGELEGLLLTIQNDPGKRILKHKIQQSLKEKRHNNWYRSRGDEETGWDDNWQDGIDHVRDWDDFSPDWGEDHWTDIR